MARWGVCVICQIIAQPGSTALDDLLMCSIVPSGFIALLLADFIISLMALYRPDRVNEELLEARARARADGGAKSAPSFFFNWCKSETLWTVCGSGCHACNQRKVRQQVESFMYIYIKLFFSVFCFVLFLLRQILLRSHADFFFLVLFLIVILF